MSIDTEDKRRSTYVEPFGHVDPVPDGTMALLDRVHVTWIYRDFVSSGATPPGDPIEDMSDEEIIRECYDPEMHALRLKKV